MGLKMKRILESNILMGQKHSASNYQLNWDDQPFFHNIIHLKHMLPDDSIFSIYDEEKYPDLKESKLIFINEYGKLAKLGLDFQEDGINTNNSSKKLEEILKK